MNQRQTGGARLQPGDPVTTIVIAAAVGAALSACGGETVAQHGDGGAVRRDSSTDVRVRVLDARHDVHDAPSVDAPVDSPLSDACAELSACCSWVPQVAYYDCLAYLSHSPMHCQNALVQFMQLGYLDGGPCVGVGHPVAACQTLATCCASMGGGSSEPPCEMVVEAGNAHACANYYQMAVGNDLCESCTGACN
jgi:hypothetical protein